MSKNKRLIFLTVVILASSMWLLQSAKPLQPYNVILITINTLRADHVGAYGYFRNTTPHIDELTKESVVFEDAVTQSPVTWTSHASIFTSQYPSVHGLLEPEPLGKLSEASLTLAEVLNEHGWKTAAFVGKEGGVRKVFGLAQGFDVYAGEDDGSFSETLPRGVEWLKANKKSKFFLFIHGDDVHDPYISPDQYVHVFDPNYKGVLNHERFFRQTPRSNINFAYAIKKVKNDGFIIESGAEKIPLTKEDINHVIAHYDGGILYVDALLDQFLKELKTLGLYDNSIIIISGDHGESLGDSLIRPDVHDERVFGHGILYEEMIRVPLIIKLPDKQLRKISSQVELIDIFPTLLEYVNIPLSKNIKNRTQGKSLIPLIKGGNKDLHEFTFGEGSSAWNHSVFIRTKNWKLIKGGSNLEFYNLKDDPKEIHNLIDSYPDVAHDLKQKLDEWELKNLGKKAKLK